MATKNPRIKYDVSVNVKPLVDGMRVGGKAVDNLAGKTRRAGRATKQAERETVKFKQAWDGIKKLSAGSGTGLGQMTASLGDLGEGLAEVGAASAGFGLAATALGAFGLVATAQIAAIGGAAKAFFDATLALDDLTAKALKAATGLEEMGIVLDRDVRAALDESEAASARLHASFDLLTIKLATELGPAFGYMSDSVIVANHNMGQLVATSVALKDSALTGLSEELGHNAESVRKWHDILTGVTETLGGLAKEVAVASSGMYVLRALTTTNAKAALKDADAVRLHGIAHQALTEAIDLRNKTEKERRDAIALSIAAEKEMERAAQAAASERERRHKDELRRIDEEKKARIKAADDKRTTELEALKESWASARRLEALGAHLAETRLANLETSKRAEKEHRMFIADQAIEAGQATMGMIDMVLQARLSAINTSTAAGRDEARKIFAVQKAVAIAQTIMATASAVMQNAGAYPMPWALIPMAIAATVGTAQVAVIAAQQPSFPVGGVIPAGMQGRGTSSDHQPIEAMAGEAVLNRRAVENLGEGGVNALNRGGGGGSQVVVVPMYQHRVFDAFVVDNMAHNGPLAQKFDKQARPGKIRRTR